MYEVGMSGCSSSPSSYPPISLALTNDSSTEAVGAPYRAQPVIVQVRGPRGFRIHLSQRIPTMRGSDENADRSNAMCIRGISQIARAPAALR
jgi:hypothetical protein